MWSGSPGTEDSEEEPAAVEAGEQEVAGEVAEDLPED